MNGWNLEVKKVDSKFVDKNNDEVVVGKIEKNENQKNIVS